MLNKTQESIGLWKKWTEKETAEEKNISFSNIERLNLILAMDWYERTKSILYLSCAQFMNCITEKWSISLKF